MSRIELDCRRLLCPMPVIRVQNRVAELEQGVILAAYCTDPGVLHDIPAWCRINGHKIIETHSDKSEYIVVIEVGEAE